jgi:hypothetical protein
MITLVCYDLITKVKENIEEFQIFPTAFGIGFHDILDNGASKTRRAKMISLHEFQTDSVII